MHFERARRQRILHFFGHVVSDEGDWLAAEREACERLEAIAARDPHIRPALDAYLARDRWLTVPTTTLTLPTRLGGLTAVIANALADRPVHDSWAALRDPGLRESPGFRADPGFADWAESARPRQRLLENSRSLRDRVRIADFGCAPKAGGAPGLMFMREHLRHCHPDTELSFHGVDIDFPSRYPRLTRMESFDGWSEGYHFDANGHSSVDGIHYYDASSHPGYDILSASFDSRSFPRFDFVVCSLFYSVLELAGAPAPLLARARANLRSTLSEEGVLLLHTAADHVELYRRGGTERLPFVIPFTPHPQEIQSKARSLLRGGPYTVGLLSNWPLDAPEAACVEERLVTAVRRAYQHSSLCAGATDRVFRAFEQIDEGAKFDEVLTTLESPEIRFSFAHRENLRARIRAQRRTRSSGAPAPVGSAVGSVALQGSAKPLGDVEGISRHDARSVRLHRGPVGHTE